MTSQPERISSLAPASYKRLRYIRRSIGYDVNRFLDFLWISKGTYYRLKYGMFPKATIRSQILEKLAELDAAGKLTSEIQQQALKDVRTIFQHKNAVEAKADEIRRLRNRAISQPVVGQSISPGTIVVVVVKDEQHLRDVLSDAFRSMQIPVIWSMPSTVGEYLQEE